MINRNVDDLHPDSSRWYRLTWPQDKLGTGTTITGYTWTVPAGLQADSVSQSGLETAVRLSVTTGVAGTAYDVVCQITTSNNQTLHETIRIFISSEGH